MFEPVTHDDVITVDGIVSAFYYHCSPHFYFGGESHDFWEFLFADRGEVTIRTNEKRYDLHPGELVFLWPGEFHSVETTNRNGASFFVCSFFCTSPAATGFANRIYPLGEREKRQLRETAAAARKAFGPEFTEHPNAGPGENYCLNPADYQTLKNTLELFLLTVLCSDSLPIQVRADSFRQQLLRSRLAESVTALLSDRIGEPLTLSQISRELGFSVSLLKKEYKAATGCSIMSSFLDLKIKHAKHLLMLGEATHTQIAHSLGYEDERYFYRLFKQRTGMTMTEYAHSIDPD